MKTSILINKYGSAESLDIEKTPQKESLDKHEIEIDVHYSGINYADIVMRVGLYQDAPPKPFVPGYEVSGVVSNVGSEVKNYNVGDEVLAGTRFGGYSSSVIVPVEQVLKKPTHLNMKEAAAIPVNFMTCYIMLIEIARLKKGDKVLIDCATGGIGSIALQMLEKMGAETYGLSTTEKKFKYITQYNAQPILRSEFTDFPDKDFKFILNSSGDRKAINSQLDHLDLGGHLFLLGINSILKDGKKSLARTLKTLIGAPFFHTFSFLQKNRTISGANILNYFDHPKWLIKTFQALKESDYLKPNIGKVYSFKDVTQAHLDLEQGKAFGKLLLDWKNH